VHPTLKRTAERVLCRAGIARTLRAVRRSNTVILAYHNIVPAGQVVRGESSLHLPQPEFARQLDLLQRTHEIIPLASLTRPNRGSRPRAVITFDDACEGALTAGLAELSGRGLPATIFVAPAFIEGRSYWWDALAGEASGELSEAVRRHALDALQGKDEAIRSWAAEQSLPMRSVPAHQCGASTTQLTRAAATPGITLASHSWSHANLERVEGAELESELVRPLAWLRERFEGVLPWLSYPYGRHSQATRQAAEAAGYEGALLITGGWVSEAEPPRLYAVPRMNVPAGLSLAGFELRTAGL
jgi:peptidoglycan/xylan/chitin deacetylase (PgdA/CDA1 family)